MVFPSGVYGFGHARNVNICLRKVSFTVGEKKNKSKKNRHKKIKLGRVAFI
jgi:hypothetical protein